jgi:flagellar basal-body rod protein FlgF
VAVTSASWIAVQAADGSEAYTRRGDLSVAASGVLETGDGFPVMGSGGPITVPLHQAIAIADDGTVSIVPAGGDPTQPQVIDKIKLASPEGSQTIKGLDNLLHVKGGGVLPEDLDARLQAGALEQSNVNLTQALVDMIENQRSYEVQASLLKEAKTMDESAASLMRMPA